MRSASAIAIFVAGVRFVAHSSYADGIDLVRLCRKYEKTIDRVAGGSDNNMSRVVADMTREVRDVQTKGGGTMEEVAA